MAQQERIRVIEGLLRHRDEDYTVAAASHRGTLSGAQDYITFRRNEPALHHYHNTYREALGMLPLQVISN